MQTSSIETGSVHVYAGKLFDSITGSILINQLIIIDRKSGRINSVQPIPLDGPVGPGDDGTAEVIDLRHLIVVPGFVDVHVHLFLHPYSETSWVDQLTKETLVERTVRATNHARSTLLAGFTTVRDLGTEGAGDSDVALRHCINKGLIPGPRYFCSNRAIVSTGSYGPKSSIHPDQEGVEGITGAEVADGVDECVKAVRRQISAGADWIKIYADYRILTRHANSALSHLSLPTFSPLELEAMISTACSYSCPLPWSGFIEDGQSIPHSRPLIRVAAHATNKSTINTLLRLGIDSIEHGTDMFGYPEYERRRGSPPTLRPSDIEELVQLFEESKATWVPTLAAYYTMRTGQGGTGRADAWVRGQRTFKAALPYIASFGSRSSYAPGHSRPRMRVAVGGDTGVFAHGDNALEMKLMVRLGADWRDVLRWATLGGWACITGNDLDQLEDVLDAPDVYTAGGTGFDEDMDGIRFGAIRAGWAADLVGLAGDCGNFGKDTASFETAIDRETGVKFVMKSGSVCRWEK